MSPESLILAQAWLKKASSDLAAASILIHGEQKHLDVGSYHCQQAAEKAIKAYLTARETLFPKDGENLCGRDLTGGRRRAENGRSYGE
jgi:hypothetical protein